MEGLSNLVRHAVKVLLKSGAMNGFDGYEWLRIGMHLLSTGVIAS